MNHHRLHTSVVNGLVIQPILGMAQRHQGVRVRMATPQIRLVLPVAYIYTYPDIYSYILSDMMGVNQYL